MAFLSGCGSGGGASKTPSPIITPTPTPGSTITPVTTLPMPRSQPTGDIANQINQYSTAIDNLSVVWATPSDSLQALQDYTGAGRGTRATGSVEDFFAATYYGYRVARAAQQRLQAAIVALDDAAYLGELTSKNNSLTGSDSIHNPQWVAATLEYYYHNLRFLNAVTAFYQTAGLRQMGKAVLAGSDFTQRAVGYCFLATIFNDWVTKLSQTVGIAADPTWYLVTNRKLSDADIASEISRLDDIVYALPLGPAQFPTLADASRDTTPLDSPCYMAAESPIVKNGETFWGDFYENIVDQGVEAVTEIADGTYEKKLGVSFGAGVLEGQLEQAAEKAAAEKKESLLGRLLTPLKVIVGAAADAGAKQFGDFVANQLGEQYGEIADGFVRIAPKIFFYATEVTLSVFEHAGKLDPTFLTDYAIATADLAKDIQNELGKVEDGKYRRLIEAQADIDKIVQTQQVLRGMTLTTIQTPAAVNAKNAECDQLARAGVNRGSITSGSVSGSTVSMSDPNDNRQALCGQTANSRAVGNLPRTYANMEIAAFNLLLDYANRNPDYLQPQQSGQTLSFLRSDFALLIRRTPDIAAIQVPAITDAQLLCTSPDFIPIRNVPPLDLSKTDSLQVFNPLSGLSLGVGINVH